MQYIIVYCYLVVLKEVSKKDIFENLPFISIIRFYPKYCKTNCLNKLYINNVIVIKSYKSYQKVKRELFILFRHIHIHIHITHIHIISI